MKINPYIKAFISGEKERIQRSDNLRNGFRKQLSNKISIFSGLGM
jgi:hypothetical protein